MATQNPIRYKSLLAWSSNSVGVPAGAQATLTWSISEQGISGRFVADTTTGVFSSLIHRNVNLSTGFSPLSLLQSDSEINPRSRRFVAVNGYDCPNFIKAGPFEFNCYTKRFG